MAGRLELAVSRRPPSLALWLTPKNCLSVLMMWGTGFPYLRVSDPKENKAETTASFGPDLGSHTPSFLQSPIGYTGQSYPG
jgi:hypothetical protein